MLYPGAMLQNRYQIIRLLGQGGMGAVYQARDIRLPGKQWAIKEMTDALITDPIERNEAIESFRQEARLLATLEHQNLPQVSDAFEEGGKQFIVMDYIEGQTFEKIIGTTTGFLPEATVLAWAEQLCNVLDYLHGLHPPVIFRDLKPSNIKLMPDGNLKLIDFGIARFFKPGKTKDTAKYGNIGYAAPEQFGTDQTDARSDIYSFGVTLHRLLTKYDPAQTPFNLPTVRSINPYVSAQTEAVIARATQTAPINRLQSVKEMGRALQSGEIKAPAPLVSNPLSSQTLAACDKCGRRDDTLRVTAFLYVISIIVMTFKRGWGGVLCRSCRVKYGLLLAALSVTLGPWGLPWGLIYTLEAFFTNLSGGNQPKPSNTQLLAYQGARFAERRDYASAYSCLAASLGFESDPAVERSLNQVKPFVPPAMPSSGLSSEMKWVIGSVVAALALIPLAFLISSNSPARVVAIAPTATVTPTKTPAVTPTLDTDGVIKEVSALYSGPGNNYATLYTLNRGTRLKVIGRDPRGTDWILVEDPVGLTGWLMQDGVTLRASFTSLPFTLLPPTLAPPSPTTPSTDRSTATRLAVTATTRPSPTSTKISARSCPANSALVQLNNFLDVAATFELSGPPSPTVVVRAKGSAKICIPPGFYVITSSAKGYKDDFDVEKLESESEVPCNGYSIWPSSMSRPSTSCSKNRAEYSPP